MQTYPKPQADIYACDLYVNSGVHKMVAFSNLRICLFVFGLTLFQRQYFCYVKTAIYPVQKFKGVIISANPFSAKCNFSAQNTDGGHILHKHPDPHNSHVEMYRREYLQIVLCKINNECFFFYFLQSFKEHNIYTDKLTTYNYYTIIHGNIDLTTQIIPK